jgi:hypothetical protein
MSIPSILSPELFTLLHSYFSEEQKIETWLNSSNFSLGGETPAARLLLPGGEAALLELLGQLIHGHAV